MTRAAPSHIVTVIALLVLCAKGESTQIIYLPMTPEKIAIRDAAMIDAPAERQKALRLALEKGLIESDESSRSLVYSYVVEISRWLDFSPYTVTFI